MRTRALAPQTVCASRLGGEVCAQQAGRSRKARIRGGAALLAAQFLLLAGGLAGQISPGPLTHAHDSISGPTQCTSCHVVGKGSAVLKCQECHTEIAAELAKGQGLHAQFADRENCAKCHSEHNGADFPLIRWQPSLKGFDHAQTGYRLEGKHAGIDCNRCHTAAHIQTAAKPLIKMKDLNRGFLGLSPECTSCHEDPHKGQLGNDCTQCHNTVDWKAATKIDHSKTRFPLTGLHAQVACEKCHAPETPGGAPRLTGMAFGKCSDCHSDPHHGAFPQACESCHTTGGWKKIPATQSFDHSKTKFPLLGKHAEVDCVQCHADGNFKKEIGFANCSDCHQDAHGGQFTARADKGECSTCHTVEGWKPSLFDVKAHAATGYPLGGKHAAVECAKCHIPAGKATRYKIAFAQCTDCHQDAHGGQFAARADKGECSACHTVKGFQPSTFTIALHQKSRFALGGAHLAVTCAECHTPDPAQPGSKLARYRFADVTCTGCHTNPHGGKFAAEMAKVGANGRAAGCEACHTVKSWLELPSFDHAKTEFPLTGAHAKVSCEQCHKPTGKETQLTEASFQATPKACASCHQDPHAGQFMKNGKAEKCETCHGTEHWSPSNFDHETQSDFSLKGAHEKVECAACHTGFREVGGKRVRFYKPTPRQCAGCHS